MIRLDRHLAPPHLHRRPRGFSWWYVDVCGIPGEALVLIWARGLPFVPTEPGRTAVDELSVAVAVYRNGREHFYALRCEPTDGAAWEERPGELRIGRSVFRFREGHGVVELRADLDLDVPAMGALRGVVELAGAPAAVAHGTGGLLDWAPIALAARGHASLAWDGGSAHIVGRGYFDGNAADSPLASMGIRDWRWGRVALPTRDVVYFTLDPDHPVQRKPPVVLSVDERGRATIASGARADFRDGLPGWFGLRRAEQLSLRAGELGDVAIRFVDQVEDGPFYQRYLIEARSSFGEVGRGVAERVVPGRLDRAWHRPLVNMRVDRSGRRRSSWLPLFSGAGEGRLRRLVASWLQTRTSGVEAWR